MRFNLESKTYKDEIYRADIGQGLSAVVGMYYHTFRKYWHVTYYIGYPPYYRVTVSGVDYLETRKEARKAAQKIMDEAKPDDWKRLPEFDQNNIRKSLVQTPKFMQI